MNATSPTNPAYLAKGDDAFLQTRHAISNNRHAATVERLRDGIAVMEEHFLELTTKREEALLRDAAVAEHQRHDGPWTEPGHAERGHAKSEWDW